MPIISYFFGITIRMNLEDHNPPHFHAEYQGHDAVYAIESSTLIAGNLPGPASKIVFDWAKKNKAQLKDDWKRARNLQPLLKIPGADQ